MVASLAESVGVEHVAIGSDAVLGWSPDSLGWMRNGRWTKQPDYGEGTATVKDWPAPLTWLRNSADFSNLTQGLLDKGFTQEETAKIMGQNWLNFFDSSFIPA